MKKKPLDLELVSQKEAIAYIELHNFPHISLDTKTNTFDIIIPQAKKRAEESKFSVAQPEKRQSTKLDNEVQRDNINVSQTKELHDESKTSVGPQKKKLQTITSVLQQEKPPQTMKNAENKIWWSTNRQGKKAHVTLTKDYETKLIRIDILFPKEDFKEVPYFSFKNHIADLKNIFYLLRIHLTFFLSDEDVEALNWLSCEEKLFSELKREMNIDKIKAVSFKYTQEIYRGHFRIAF
jgi:hypothetical protein